MNENKKVKKTAPPQTNGNSSTALSQGLNSSEKSSKAPSNENNITTKEGSAGKPTKDGKGAENSSTALSPDLNQKTKAPTQVQTNQAPAKNNNPVFEILKAYRKWLRPIRYMQPPSVDEMIPQAWADNKRISRMALLFSIDLIKFQAMDYPTRLTTWARHIILTFEPLGGASYQDHGNHHLRESLYRAWINSAPIDETYDHDLDPQVRSRVFFSDLHFLGAQPGYELFPEHLMHRIWLSLAFRDTTNIDMTMQPFESCYRLTDSSTDRNYMCSFVARIRIPSEKKQNLGANSFAINCVNKDNRDKLEEEQIHYEYNPKWKAVPPVVHIAKKPPANPPVVPPLIPPVVPQIISPSVPPIPPIRLASKLGFGSTQTKEERKQMEEDNRLADLRQEDKENKKVEKEQLKELMKDIFSEDVSSNTSDASNDSSSSPSKDSKSIDSDDSDDSDATKRKRRHREKTPSRKSPLDSQNLSSLFISSTTPLHLLPKTDITDDSRHRQSTKTSKNPDDSRHRQDDSKDSRYRHDESKKFQAPPG